MRILSKCINSFLLPTKSCSENQPHGFYGFSYCESEVYLGKCGRFLSEDGVHEICIYYSDNRRDGLGWTYRTKIPPKLMFDYFDGAVIWRDDSFDYSDIIEQLNVLKEKAHAQKCRVTFDQLRVLTQQFLSIHFFPNSN